jgi:hypothetical protein
MYEQCEELAGDEIDEIFRQFKDAPGVKVVPNFDGPNVLEATRRVGQSRLRLGSVI